MSYQKTDWQPKTPISPPNLRKMETQFELAVIDLPFIIRLDINLEFRAESLSSAPAHANGRMYFNSSENRLRGSADGEWLNLDAQQMTGIS